MALSELMNIDSAKINNQEVKLNFLKGIAYFGLHEDDLSEEAFRKCAEGLSSNTGTSEIETDFNAIRKSEKRYNPHTAWLLSLLVPGAGQLYSGEFKEAANSAALLGGLLYLTVSFAGKYSVFEAIAVVLPWFQRYYMGGANKAEKLTLEKQLANRYQSYQSIMKRLEVECQKNQMK
ncbi:MAG: hypothetical protein Q8S54_02480 [Bacteroidota bacterium]|nr:hypothetical protein [Bacteroidota bacterium]